MPGASETDLAEIDPVAQDGEHALKFHGSVGSLRTETRRALRLSRRDLLGGLIHEYGLAATA
jgi:hypothetical protein